MPMNTELVGRSYPETRYRVSTEATQKYALATNDFNPRFFEGAPDLIAPPVFPVVYHPRALGQAIGDPELGIDFKRALHGEQDMRFHAPIRPDDEITTAARIESIRAKGTGETITLDLVSHNQNGVLVESTLFTLFVRGPSGAPSNDREKSAAERPAPASDPIARVAQQLDDDQTFRYSEASGDRTKIHLDEGAARRAGLPGIIGHGLCTMAFVSRALIDELADGDPTRLARLSLRFAQPVIPGETLETSIWSSDTPGTFSFETVDPRKAPVVSQGLVEIRSETS
ncbi:MAG: dehydratase [bacterium]|nr:dehydratase [bacterium]